MYVATGGLYRKAFGKARNATVSEEEPAMIMQLGTSLQAQDGTCVVLDEEKLKEMGITLSPSPECMKKIEELERQHREALWRAKDILVG